MLGELREVYDGFVEEFKDSSNGNDENNSRSDINNGDSNYIDSSNRSR